MAEALSSSELGRPGYVARSIAGCNREREREREREGGGGGGGGGK